MSIHLYIQSLFSHSKKKKQENKNNNTQKTTCQLYTEQRQHPLLALPREGTQIHQH